MEPDYSFRHGVKLGAATSGTLVAALYMLAAPTNDYRARISVLLGAAVIPGGLSIFGVFVLSGIGCLAITRSFSAQAAKGVVLASLATEMFVYSWQLHRILPEFESLTVRWVCFGLACAVSISGIVFSGRRYRERLRSRTPIAYPD